MAMREGGKILGGVLQRSQGVCETGDDRKGD